MKLFKKEKKHRWLINWFSSINGEMTKGLDEWYHSSSFRIFKKKDK